ncbi:MAG: hypothetical protein BM564_06460 [Bacteroidetes bacterium MedPE-SWsnd-G2]|mgnify:CR=1 FL=1|nr:MAG: hypothetical protein BM564_06460 [Bacteroidetes bacterium MedPE-SWsnd-G2]
MNWFKKSSTCSHCNTNKTKREFEGRPTCPDCKTKMLLSREPKRICPVDGEVLTKEHSNEIILDRCPKCKGIWLDPGEIEAIKEAAKAEGLALGMVL